MARGVSTAAAAAPQLLAWLWGAAWAVWGACGTSQIGPCTFNHLCTCTYSDDAPTAAYVYTSPLAQDKITELTCVGVPFARIPGEHED